MKGLTLFISDIRKCKSKEEEIKRINKELANIRHKFGGNKPLKGYDKKKYVCKLVFMFLLGYKNDGDFGYIDAINLLSSNAYSEKQIGYLFLSVVYKNGHSFMPLLKNALQNDLTSSNLVFKNMALQFIANHPNKDLSESFGDQVLWLLTSFDEATTFVKQTAALTLLQLVKYKPDLVSSEQYSDPISSLLSHYDLGLATASASLVDHLASLYPHDYKSCVKHAIIRLSRIVSAPVQDFRDYSYNNMAVPWLAIKLMKILQKFSLPSDMALIIRFREALEIILNKADEPVKTKRFEERNIKYAVIFEGIRTAVQVNISPELLSKTLKILTNTLRHKEVNLRHITMDIMAELSKMSDWRIRIKFHWGTILNTLRTERDITIKKSAVDLLYNICDRTIVKDIVEELMLFLEETEQSAMDEVVLKLAILSERFSTDHKWYVNTVFKLLYVCTASISDNIYFTLVKIVTDNHRVHDHAARAAYAYLAMEPVNDNVVKASGYILGEFGHLIANDPNTGYLQQLDLLKSRYPICASSTQALLLTTYMKFLNLYPDLKEQIQSLLLKESNIYSENIEIQQRAVEYLKLSQCASAGLLSKVFDEMPPWNRENSVVVKALEKRRADRTAMAQAIPPTNLIPRACSADNLNVPSNNELARSVSHYDLRPGNVSNVDLLIDVFGETCNPFSYIGPES